jgi:hypothetical protein
MEKQAIPAKLTANRDEPNSMKRAVSSMANVVNATTTINHNVLISST